MGALAITASTLDAIATEIRHLARTEVREVQEPFARARRVRARCPTSGTPSGERVTGLARVIRGNLQAALENTVLWHERDISHSSAERVILPDSTIALHFMLSEMREVLEGLEVYPERMRENLDVGGGLAFSQNVLLALVTRVVSRRGVRDRADGGGGRVGRGRVVPRPTRRGRTRARTDRRPARRAVRPRRRCGTSTSCSTGSRRSRSARMSGTARLHGQGKVRDIYDVGDERVLLVATDRISAFDVVLPDPIPDKGRVLTGLTLFWLERTTDVVPNHLASADRGTSPSPSAASRRSPGRRCSRRGRR